MNLEELLNANDEIIDLIRKTLSKAYGTSYSNVQIREALTIALLTGEVFQEVITKVQRERYCHNKNN